MSVKINTYLKVINKGSILKYPKLLKWGEEFHTINHNTSFDNDKKDISYFEDYNSELIAFIDECIELPSILINGIYWTIGDIFLMDDHVYLFGFDRNTQSYGGFKDNHFYPLRNNYTRLNSFFDAPKEYSLKLWNLPLLKLGEGGGWDKVIQIIK